MEKTSKELLKEFVNSQQFTSTTDIKHVFFGEPVMKRNRIDNPQ